MTIRYVLLKVAEFMERNPCPMPGPRGWISFTTFSRLSVDAGYWSLPMLMPSEIGENGTNDGGTWGQLFKFEDFAHIIFPKRFYWEVYDTDKWIMGHSIQNLGSITSEIVGSGHVVSMRKYGTEINVFDALGLH